MSSFDSHAGASARRRIGLVGCVKQKRSERSRARDLYTSDLFVKRVRYVERTCNEWWILSALHGLAGPEDLLETYDVTLTTMRRAAKRVWADRALEEIAVRIDPADGDIVEFHAGADYRDFGLAAGLADLGLVVENPTQGLSIGQQMQFYNRAVNPP